MGFVKATEAKQPTFIKCLIYGKAGVGKTTLALSAPKPAVIDFDNGLHRVNYQHRYGVDVLQPRDWKEVMNTLADVQSMSGYETIVVDTIDKMMDFIITYKCGTRQPILKDWGGINAEFTAFCRAIDSLQKNVIFLAHETSTTEKDVTCYRPALREKNFIAVQNELDVLAFLHRKDIKGITTRVLTYYAPDCEGKKPSNFPDEEIVPAVLDAKGIKTGSNDFFGREILGKYVTLKSQEASDMKVYAELMSAIESDLANVTDADSANQFVEYQKSYKHVGNSAEVVRQLFSARVKSLGLTYDKASRLYVAA